MLADFHNSFTVVFSMKFEITPVPYFPPHLRCFAALPCANNCQSYERMYSGTFFHSLGIVLNSHQRALTGRKGLQDSDNRTLKYATINCYISIP